MINHAMISVSVIQYDFSSLEHNHSRLGNLTFTVRETNSAAIQGGFRGATIGSPWCRETIVYQTAIFEMFFRDDSLSDSCTWDVVFVVFPGRESLKQIVYWKWFAQTSHRCHGRAWGGGQGDMSPPSFWKTLFVPPSFDQRKKNYLKITNLLRLFWIGH